MQRRLWRRRLLQRRVYRRQRRRLGFILSGILARASFLVLVRHVVRGSASSKSVRWATVASSRSRPLSSSPEKDEGATVAFFTLETNDQSAGGLELPSPSGKGVPIDCR